MKHRTTTFKLSQRRAEKSVGLLREAFQELDRSTGVDYDSTVLEVMESLAEKLQDDLATMRAFIPEEIGQ